MGTTSREERFWRKVAVGEPGECWLWLASCNRNGYGYTGLVGLPKLAHRAAYELTNGPIPEGLVLRHSCDRPPCCNPDHLEPGTQRQNVEDAIRRGRFRSVRDNISRQVGDAR